MAISPPAVLINFARFFSLHTGEVSISDFQQLSRGKFHIALCTQYRTQYLKAYTVGKGTKAFGYNSLINSLYMCWQKVLTFSTAVGIAERLRVTKVNNKGFLKSQICTPLQLALWHMQSSHIFGKILP